MSDEDSDIDMDEWMAMSEEQQDAMIANAMRDYNAWIDAMSREDFFAYRRARRVACCLRLRRLIRDHDMPLLQQLLRKAQRMLVALRAERKSGSAPVSADLN